MTTTSLRLPVVAVLAACVAWSVGYAFSSFVRPAYTALLAVVAVLEAEASRRVTERREVPAGASLLAWRHLEWVLLVVVAFALHLVLPGRPRPADPIGPEVIVGLGVVLLVWALAQATFHDLDRLGFPAVEGRSSSFPGGTGPLVARFLGGAVVVAGSIAVGVSGWSSLADIGRPSVPGPVVPLTVYLCVGVAGIGWVSFHDARLRWRREEARVEPGVGGRWAAGVAVCLLAGALVFALSPVAAKPVIHGTWAVAGRLAASFGKEPTGRGLGGAAGVAGSPSSGLARSGLPPSGPASPAPGGASEWVAGIAFVVVMLLLVTVAFLRVGLRRRASPERLLAPLAFAAVVGRTVLGVVAALGRVVKAMMWWWRHRVRHSPSEAGSPAETVDRRPAWAETAGREQLGVAHLYHRFLELAGARVGRRRPPETPWEFARRVSAVLGGIPGVEPLTESFVVARYSAHELGGEQLAEAREHLSRFEAALHRRSPTGEE